MHLLSFQDTDLKPCREVKGYPGEVIGGYWLTILGDAHGGWAYEG